MEILLFYHLQVARVNLLYNDFYYNNRNTHVSIFVIFSRGTTRYLNSNIKKIFLKNVRFYFYFIAILGTNQNAIWKYKFE